MGTEVTETLDGGVAPAVTDATEFQMRGFKADGELEAEAPIEVTAEDADAIAAQIQAGGTPPLDGEVPTAPAPKAKIKIAGKEFATQEEAFAYAEELERQNLANDAFRQGIEAAQRNAESNLPAAPAPPEPTPEEISAEMFANPAEFLKKRDQQNEERILARLNQSRTAESAERNLWDNFRKTYPDLSTDADLAEVQSYIRQPQNWAILSKTETNKALKMAADAIRARHQEIANKYAPGTVLKKVATTGAPGTGREVTRPQTKEKELSFVEQLRQNRKKPGAAARG